MRNALEETMEAIEGRTIDYGYMYLEKEYDVQNPSIQFTSHRDFLSKSEIFNQKYDAGYGSQQFFGCIVFTDGTWIDRGEYDGSEWWQNHVKPTKDEILKEIPL